MTKSRHSRNLTSRQTPNVPAPAAGPVPHGTRTATPQAKARPIRSDIDGLSAVMDALSGRQFDLYTLSNTEWRRMSRRQQVDIVRQHNRSQRLDHTLGPRYFDSPTLTRAVQRAHDLYLAMTPEQRRQVLHPKHLDQWLADRWVLTIVARDLEDAEPVPDSLRPASYAIADEGPSPTWLGGVYLTVSINLEAPLQTVWRAVEDLIAGLHAPAARRPRRGSSPRPRRQKYDDDDVARMIAWYYQQGAGASLKHLAIEAAGPTARHVAATRSTILRQLRWFRCELGIA